MKALKTVEKHKEQVGHLFLPIVLEKWRNIITLQISRELGNKNWSIDKFLECINTEITTPEGYEFLKRDQG